MDWSQLLAWLTASAMTPWALVAVFAVAWMDGWFPPVPSEAVVTVVAVVMSQHDPRRLWLLALIALGGAWAGDNTAYLIGRWLHRPLRRRLPGLHSKVERISGAIARRGSMLIITGRMIPAIRIVVNMGAGLERFPHHRFMWVDAVAVSWWAGSSVLIGLLAERVSVNHPWLGLAIGGGLGILLGVALDRGLAAYHRHRGEPAFVLDPEPGKPAVRV